MEKQPLKCIAVDDEPLALRLLQQHADRTEGLLLEKVFDDALAAREYLRNEKVDVLFVDIRMPDISGLQLVRELDGAKPLVVFTTAYRDFAFEGYELDAADYLLKPVSYERFLKAVEKLRKLVLPQPGGGGQLLVRSEYRLLKIPFEEIEYIVSMVDYVKIYRRNAPHPVLSLISLREVLKELPEAGFSRIHRGIIVNLAAVEAIRGKKVLLYSGKELPVSASNAGFIEKWKAR